MDGFTHSCSEILDTRQYYTLVHKGGRFSGGETFGTPKFWHLVYSSKLSGKKCVAPVPGVRTWPEHIITNHVAKERQY